MIVKSKVKYIQSLGQKKFRESEGCFIAEGPKIVEALLACTPEHIKEVVALPAWLQAQSQLPPHISFLEATEEELQKCSLLQTANRVLAVVRMYDSTEPEPAKGKITLALDTLQDPGNFGTLVRIADWFAVDQVVCSHDSADLYNPKVVQATMGSIARVKVFYTSLRDWLAAQQQTRIFAAALQGQPVGLLPKISEGVILIGNESRGISPELMELANVKITIPSRTADYRLKQSAESLNAAVAAAVILSHLLP